MLSLFKKKTLYEKNQLVKIYLCQRQEKNIGSDDLNLHKMASTATEAVEVLINSKMNITLAQTFNN